MRSGKKLIFLAGCAAMVPCLLWAQSQGENLLSLGFYAGAEDALSQEVAANPTRENVKDLIQARLAQGKTPQAKEALESGGLLTPAERALYRALIQLQEGTLPQGIDISPAGLDPKESECLSYICGLADFSKKDYKGAETFWMKIPAGSIFEPWVQGLSTGMGSPETPMSLEKRFPKMRAQDWPIMRCYLLGMIAHGESAQAREFMEKNSAKLPKAEIALLTALSYPAQTTERAASLIKALSVTDDPRLLVIEVGLCEEETVINMNDVQESLQKKEPYVALILAQGWAQKGSVPQAYDLLAASSPEGLPLQWQSAWYSTLGSLAEKLSPPRHREAANALSKLRDLPTTSSSQKNLIEQQMGDIFFKNGDFADAAVAYEKLRACGLQTTLAWLKAEKPDDAKRVLLRGGFNDFPQALLAYLMYIRDHDRSLEDAYKPFARVTLPLSERWPIEYLRVEGLTNTKPEVAMEKLLSLDIPSSADYAPYFEMEKYRLLLKLGRKDEAQKMLDEMLARKNIPQEFALLGLEQAFLEQRPEAAMEIIPKTNRLPDADRVNLMVLVAESLGNSPEALQKAQKAIENLPPDERVEPMILLAKRWAVIGQTDKARAIIDALKESSIASADRDEVDFLRATIDALTGDPSAEAELAALSERPEQPVRLRGLIRLAAYEAEHGKLQAAQEIFYKKLAPLIAAPLPQSLLPQKEELLKSMITLAGVLPEKDGLRLKDWVSDQLNG